VRLLFSEYTLDTERRELQRGSTKVDLGPRSFSLLHLLAANRSRVVPKDEIHQVVWQGRDVSSSTIPTAVSVLRKILGDDPHEPRFIQSRYGVGYRFVAEVRELVEDRPSVRPALVAVIEADQRALFVGRKLELSEIEEWVSGSRGTGRLVLLSGSAGAGKSRVLERFVARRIEEGEDVVFAHCREVGDSAPYATVAELCRALEELPGTVFEGAAAEHREMVAALSIDGGAISGRVSPEDSGASGRLAVRNAVVGMFEAVSAVAKPAVVIDDFHKIDHASVVVLRAVLEAIPWVRMVLSYRESEVDDLVASVIAKMDRGVGAFAVALRGLGSADSKELVEDRSGVRLSEGLVARISDLTGGNPFFLTKVADILRGRAVPNERVSTVDFEVPRATQHAVLQQIAGLSSDTRTCLECASVFGREIQIELLPELLGWPASRVDAALRESREAGVLETVGQRTRFVHVLLQSVIYENLGARAAVLHSKIFTGVKSKFGVVPGPLLAEWARHAIASKSLVSRQDRLEACSLAASWARDRFAFAESASLLSRAIEVLGERGESIDEEQRCDLLRALAECEHRCNRREAGQANARRSFSIAKKLEDAKRMAMAALAYSPGFFAIEVGVVDRFHVEALGEVRERGDRLSHELRSRIDARLAMALYWRGAREYREELANHAVEEAKRAGEDHVAYALAAREVALWDPSDPAQKEGVARIALQAAVATEDHEMELVYRVYKISNLLQLSRLAAAQEEIQLFSSKAVTLGHSNSLWFVDLFIAMSAMIRGDREAAAAATQRFVRKGGDVGDKNADHCRVVHSVYQLMEFGPVQGAVEIAQDQWKRYQRVGAYRCSLPFLYWEAGDQHAARVSFEEIAREGFGGISRNVEWLIGMAMLAEACAVLGDSARASEIYRLLLPHARECVVVGFGVAVFRPVAYFLGRLSVTMGRFRAAEDHFSVSMNISDRCASDPWKAYSLYGMADLLVRRARKGDSQRAQRLLSNCLQIAERVGMSPLKSRVERLQATLASAA